MFPLEHDCIKTEAGNTTGTLMRPNLAIEDELAATDNDVVAQSTSIVEPSNSTSVNTPLEVEAAQRVSWLSCFSLPITQFSVARGEWSLGSTKLT